MKSLIVFPSTCQRFPNFLFFSVIFVVSFVTFATSSDAGGLVNVTTSPHSDASTHTQTNKTTNDSHGDTYVDVATGVIPALASRASQLRPFLPTPPPLFHLSANRAKSTKLLVESQESQPISQFRELNNFYSHANSSKEIVLPSLSSTKDTFPSAHTFSEKRRRLLRANEHKNVVGTLNPNARRREDTNANEVSIALEGPVGSEIEFTSPVSPIEASLGGLTGLQGLPPLSFIQFIKLLVAVTPFIIPLIFIPLLIFTIGLLMIPVTRGNVFVDIGDLRAPSSSFIPSFVSSYFVNPLKSWSGSDSLVALPRSLAYDFGAKLIDTEQCVERISCEISARYLHKHWEQGNWRSIANTSWISRILNYMWGSHPTISRIAKSLNVHAGDEKMMRMTNEEEKADKDNRSRNKSVVRKFPSISPSNNVSVCSKYLCQPTTFFPILFSPSARKVSAKLIETRKNETANPLSA